MSIARIIIGGIVVIVLLAQCGGEEEKKPSRQALVESRGPGWDELLHSAGWRITTSYGNVTLAGSTDNLSEPSLFIECSSWSNATKWISISRGEDHVGPGISVDYDVLKLSGYDRRVMLGNKAVTPRYAYDGYSYGGIEFSEFKRAVEELSLTDRIHFKTATSSITHSYPTTKLKELLPEFEQRCMG